MATPDVAATAGSKEYEIDCARSQCENVPRLRVRGFAMPLETALKAFTPDEVNSWEGKDLDFQIGPRRLLFTAESFFLSFSLPNFHLKAA